VREHYRQRGSVRRALTPQLAAVGLLNLVIWLFEAEGVFHPVPLEVLRRECEAAGGAVMSSWRCYGGPDDGVGVTLVVEPVIDLQAPAPGREPEFERPVPPPVEDRSEFTPGPEPPSTQPAAP
jgi:hypothetical protein